MKRRKEKAKIREIALERIKILFEEAKRAKSQAYADRYVELARKISMKARLRMPREFKRRFCKHCYSYFIPGKNVRIRLRGKKVVCYCLRCKKYMRFPYIKKRK